MKNERKKYKLYKYLMTHKTHAPLLSIPSSVENEKSIVASCLFETGIGIMNMYC